ncbi:hypothetical protein Tco_0727493 [Tanacetum coccineum]|uniref:Uncharacterized protein n=1 Tax=Tanacetum coccineum TaxID=301880 RepID=A0ABQ4YJB8_9ASTR
MGVTDVRTYDSLNRKWRRLRPNVAQLCLSYSNVVQRNKDGSCDESAKGGFNLNNSVGEEKDEEAREIQPMRKDKAKKKVASLSIPLASSDASGDEPFVKLLVNEFTSAQLPFFQ